MSEPVATPFPQQSPVPVAPGVALAPTPNVDVARYFQQIDAIEASGPSLSDPQRFAMDLVTSSASGDTSGLDGLLQAQRSMQSRLQSMDVPEACREHHRRSLATLTSAAGVLTQLQRGLNAGDMQALAAIVPQAQQLESEARAVEALAEQIKREAGL